MVAIVHRSGQKLSTKNITIIGAAYIATISQVASNKPGIQQKIYTKGH